MKLFILGCPRSGTSMVAGLFAEQGLFSGEAPLKPTESNPKGYFEDKDINELNNSLISKGRALSFLPNRLRKRILPATEWHLSALAFSSMAQVRPRHLSSEQRSLISNFLSKDSFCYKDPRFSVTFCCWESLATSDIRKIIVFREPEKTVRSYQKNVTVIYNDVFSVSDSALYAAYARNYKRLIGNFNPRTLFFHYDQAFTQDGIDRLSEFSDILIKPDSVSNELRRTPIHTHENCRSYRKADEVYRHLCIMAGYVSRPDFTSDSSKRIPNCES